MHWLVSTGCISSKILGFGMDKLKIVRTTEVIGNADKFPGTE